MDNSLFSTIKSMTGHDNRLSVERVFCEAMGRDLVGGMFVSELVFWCDKGKRADGFFYRTATEWEERIYISEYQVRKYTKACVDYGWLETKLVKANGAPTTHYRVDKQKFLEWFLKFLGIESENFQKPGVLKFSETLTDTNTNTNTEEYAEKISESNAPAAASTPPPNSTTAGTHLAAMMENNQRRWDNRNNPQARYNIPAWKIARNNGWRPEYESLFQALEKTFRASAMVEAGHDVAIAILQKTTVALVKMGVDTVGKIEALTADWYESDWRGQKGEPPTAQQFIYHASKNMHVVNKPKPRALRAVAI